MHDPEEGDLIRKSQQGDRAAFGKLVERFYEMVYAIAYGILHEREAARDTTQEVFLKVFREIVHFEGKSKLKTWLHRIAVNAAIDETRKKHPAESLDATDAERDEDKPPVIITDHSPGPRDLASRREFREILDRGIAELSPEHRAVLVLREWQELSYEEIAETLGVEIGTVMSRLFYARKKLGEMLEKKLKGSKENSWTKNS